MRPPRAPRRPRPVVTAALLGEEERAPETPAADQGGREVLPAQEPSPARRRLLPRRDVTPAEPPTDPAVERSSFLERLAERTRARRRLAWRKVLLLAAAVTVLAGTAWAVLVSPLLALEVADVTVTGVGEGTTVAHEDVMAVVARREGTPLARLETGELVADLTQITTVRSAQVTRAWPNGLRVDVVPRVPVAVAPGDDGVVLLDVEGVVVGTAAEPPEELPNVTVPLADERAGQTLAAVLSVLAELPADLRAEVATAGAANPAAITLELADGATVRWGGPEESDLKAAVLAVLREREAGVYDVTVPRAPTISG
ncbi:cell division protein FtsQ/DivIB [uncultured Georgenia sp.]|uniref:cell division protein FtsQ/DivIB n=1 Tax=uncultured Georgenia sp. TaxID=378209 RepID=UPI0026151DAB|nr:cell division protein FtsQ/DivIB [uncultured Georgenia sp.]HLV02971.1 cell division protein FtsQ/DivIB [Actinomycetaceae bacterium]